MAGVDTLTIKTKLPESTFLVTGLSAQEQISRPFSYVVELGSGTAALDPLQLIDQAVTVTLGDPTSHGRYFSGIVQAVRQMPSHNARLWRYRLNLVPRLWFLGQTRSCRFFQNMSVPDIVQAVFAKFSITPKIMLQKSYATRDYTVMFNESYLHFVQRLLEDEGIFYFFTHDDADHTLVLADYKTAFPEITESAVQLRDAHGGYDLASWHREDAAALGEVMVDDYDPATNTLSEGAVRGQSKAAGGPKGAALRTHYTWPAVRGKTDDATDRADWRLEAAEAAAQSFAGTGGAADFVAGGKFTLQNDPTAQGAATEYVLRAVSYLVTDKADGTVGGASDIAMSCTAFQLAAQWRETPAFTAPVMAGMYTAKVIGPPGEEIYVDDLGRIKVWFPWDIEGDITSDATLWVRVMQPWGGPGWGTQFIPRVGMEVVVAFLEGDVNRPCVVGSVYNSENTPLFKAADKNKSGFRTRSTPNGGTSNYSELSIDDTMGSEVFLVHAEKDHQTEVENDQVLSVGKDRNVTIKGKQTVTVTGDHGLTVSNGNRSAEISVGNESVKAAAGAITHEAMQSITLKVGQSSIVIDQTGITIKGLMIQATGQVMATVKGPMVEVNGSGLLTLAGGIAMIN